MSAIVDFAEAVNVKTDQAIREKWHVVNGSEIAKPLEPIQWIVEELGIAPGVTIVGGAGFGGKTLAMQSLLLSVASGRPLWGHFRVREGSSIHLDWEQGHHLTHLRYQRLAYSMRVDLADVDDQIELSSLPESWLDEDDAVRVLCRLLEGKSVALIDAFRGAFPSANENDSTVRSFLDRLQRVSKHTGCAIIVIAHSRKMSDDKDVRSSLRGSGALFDAAQTVYMLDGTTGKGPCVHNTKDRLLGETRPTFGLRFENEPSPDGSDLRAGLRVEYTSPEDLKAAEIRDRNDHDDDQQIIDNAERIESIGQRILALARDGMTRAEIDGVLRHVNSRMITSALAHLHASGVLRVEGSGARATIAIVK